MKTIFQRILKNYQWGEWIDIDTFTHAHTCYLIQMKVNGNNKKVFRRTKISGSYQISTCSKHIPLSYIPEKN